MFVYKVFIGVLLVLSSPLFGSEKQTKVVDCKDTCFCGCVVSRSHDSIFCLDKLNLVSARDLGILSQPKFIEELGRAIGRREVRMGRLPSKRD